MYNSLVENRSCEREAAHWNSRKDLYGTGAGDVFIGAVLHAMIMVQLAYGGSNILVKISLDKGLNQLVFIVYRHLIAMLVLGPLAYAFERKRRPPLSIATTMKIFVLASLGVHGSFFRPSSASYIQLSCHWKLEWNLRLITIMYCGVVNAFVYYLQTWVISEKEPVFTAMFSPLLLIIVGIFSAIAFAERLHLGSLIGAIFNHWPLLCLVGQKQG